VVAPCSKVGNPRPGRAVAVVGLGGVGMAAVLTALTHDGVEVVGVNPAKSWRPRGSWARMRPIRRSRPPTPTSRPRWLWQSGRLRVEALVSSTIRLDDINEAMDNLADGRAVRQLIRFDTP
jgi:Zn-dependent alcohol dehydrogenase